MGSGIAKGLEARDRAIESTFAGAAGVCVTCRSTSKRGFYGDDGLQTIGSNGAEGLAEN